METNGIWRQLPLQSTQSAVCVDVVQHFIAGQFGEATALVQPAHRVHIGVELSVALSEARNRTRSAGNFVLARSARLSSARNCRRSAATALRSATVQEAQW